MMGDERANEPIDQGDRLERSLERWDELDAARLAELAQDPRRGCTT